MSEATYLVGDVFDRMAAMPDGSVDLVLTSPPFLALRSYLPADHPDKAKEIGSEPTPAEFLDTLLRLTAEWERVLAPHGSIAVELGDTYASSGGNDFAPRGRRGNGPGWPLDKSMCGIPHLYHLSLAYGRNLLTGEPSPAGQWRIRNVVAWVRPNPPVGALGDKFRPGTSYITVACKARDRWFDLDDVREPFKHPDHNARNPDRGSGTQGAKVNADRNDGGGGNWPSTTGGAPPLDWWQVSTEPYSGSHYATWPRKLLERPIRAMCPAEVCRTCGEPRRRIVGDVCYVLANSGEPVEAQQWERNDTGANRKQVIGRANGAVRVADTLGFTDCGHGDYRRGIVLDPFAGSGTTLAVATGLGRDAIGIDIDERNADLARDRCGMFLTVIAPGEAAA